MLDWSDYIKNKRKEMGLTQKEFAKVTQQSWITIFRWEKRISDPDPLKKVTVINILEGNKENE